MEPSTNGCKDGPTPLLVQNHSESVQQEKKTPEKHSTKTAAAAPQDISAAPATPTVTSQRTRHSVTNSKSQANKSAPVAAAAGNKTSTAKEEAAPVSRRTPRTGGAGSTPGPGRPQSKPPQREASRRPPPAEAPPVAPTSSSAAASSATPEMSPRRARKRESPRSPVGSGSDSGRASKRMRLQYQPFQSPGTLPVLALRSRPSSATSTPEDKVVVFHKGEFLAVRNETGSFYVCRTAQNVYKSSKRFKIQWLNNDSELDIYAPDFYDNTDFECVLTNLRMRRVDRGRYLLPDEERKRTLNILQRALNVENVDVSFVGKEEEEELSEASPTTTERRGRRRSSQKMEEDEEEEEDEEDDSDSDAGGRPSKGKGRPSTSKVKLKGKRGPKPSQSKWGSPASEKPEPLRPNPKVSLLEKDPFFETSGEVASVSTLADSKQLIRAVLLGDHGLLKTLLTDKDRICSVGLVRSVDVKLSALDYAVLREDHRAMQLLLEAPMGSLAPPPTNMLLHEDNLRWYPSALGPLLKPEVAQGANGALLLDSAQYMESPSIDRKRAVLLAVQHGVSQEIVEHLLEGQEDELSDLVAEALRHGHPKLAAALAKRAERCGSATGLHPLHRQVLLDNREPLPPFRPAEVVHKALGVHEVSPVHCAAVNAEHGYLSELLGALPCVEVQDAQGWRPLHYAAVSPGTATLELLLARGASLHPVDCLGDTPLHKAAMAGRARNLEVLLRSAAGSEKGAPRSVDRANKEGCTALHLAARHNHLEAAQVLVRYKADVNRAPNAPCPRTTPLMLAAQQGSCDMVQLLVTAGASVEFQDEQGRSALTHAVLNGQTPACAQLLRLGSNPNRADMWGNTPVHYAAAYGWLSCLKVLLEAGAAPHKANDAKATPVLVAFLKGHMGVVDFLLDQSGVDLKVDGQEGATGRTLAMRAMRTRLTSSVYARLQFLLERQNSDATRVDAEGNNALHHLALADSEFRERLQQQEQDLCSGGASDTDGLGVILEKERAEHERCLEQVASLLLSSGCDPAALNKEQQSPLSLALHKGSLVLVERLLESGCQPDPKALAGSPGLLHQVALLAQGRDVLPLLKALLKQPPCAEGQESEARSPRDVLRQAANGHDREGLTPLLVTLRALGRHKEDRGEPRARLLALLRFLLEELGADAAAAVRGGRGPSALHLAALCPGAEAVELLLQHKPLLEPLDPDGLTPLARALALGNCAAARALVSAGASVNVDLRDGPHLVSLLVYAAMNNLPGELIQLLLKHRAMPKSVHPATGNTALHYVVCHRNNPDLLDTVRALLDAGLDPNGANAKGRTPLHLAANANTGAVDSSTALEELLLQRAARADVRDVRGRVPLHYAFVKIRRHWDDSPCDPVELATVLLAHQPALAEMQDEFGQTPLHCAATRGASVCALTLCQKMKSVEVKDKNGNTPLGLAVLHGHAGCCVMLLQKGANSTADLVLLPTPPKDPAASDTAFWRWRYLLPKPEVTRHVPILQEVVRRSWQGILHLMLDQLENFGKNLTLAVEAALRTHSYGLALKLIGKVKHGWTLYSDKQTMLHLLAREAPRDNFQELQIRVAQALMDKGVPVMSRDEHGCSVLTYAAINWNHTLCEFFSDKIGTVAAACADPDRSLRTPFSAVFWRLQEERLPEPIQAWCLSLVQAGATADLLTCYPLRNLEFPGTRCLSEEERLHVEGPTAARLSPLILAVCKRNYTIVKMLLRAGVNSNFADGQQRTALMYAVKLNDIKMAKLLLNGSYDPEKDTDPYGDVRRSNFKKTSAVDLTHQDIYGWTALHHVVAPLPDCTYTCPAMLHLLAHVGAPLDTPDLNGVTPLHLAAARGVASLTLALQALLKLPHDQLPKVALHSLPLAQDSLDPAPGVPNFREDCSAFLEAQGAPPPREPLLDPDPFAQMEDSEVVLDKAQNVPYDVLLTTVDLGYGQHGLYSFYKMQLLQRSELVVLFSRWGRVGDSGQWRKSAYASLTEAAREFARLFRMKTGNSWEDLHNFKAQPRKYRPVQLEKRRSPPPRELPMNLSGPCPSRLPPPLQRLLRNLAEPELLARAPLSLGSEGQVALELLGQESLNTALALLEDIRQLVQEKASIQASAEQHQQESKLPELMLRIVEKSEELYCLIPVRGRRFERLEPLFEERGVQRMAALVHSLVHLQLATQLLLGAQLKATELHPLDYVYRSLRCKVQLLQEHVAEAQTVLQYVLNSAKTPPRVVGVYRVTREGEPQRLASCELSNHWLLWHATRASNLLGILASGLEVQPLAQHWNGDPMAKGICLADRFEQGRSLCQADSQEHGSKYMLLCEVALGRTRDLDLGHTGNTEPGSPGGYESTRALGRWQPHPLGTVSWHSCTVPLGRSNKAEPLQSPLSYNEYVVYKPAQVCLRYLVQFEED